MTETQTAPAARTLGETSTRVLLAPVTVTPTKPLSPSHVKGLLWADVLFRATRLVNDIEFRYRPASYHVTEQTLGFWVFLDSHIGDVDYEEMSETDIGDLYVRFRAQDTRPAVARLLQYQEAVEESGFVHPSAVRILSIWKDQYSALGMYDPGLSASAGPRLDLATLIERLHEAAMCLDLRRMGGAVYADASRYGMPLRQILDGTGRPNYLACALRELLALCDGRDQIVLMHDPELTADYVLLARVIQEVSGVEVHRLGVGRVPIEGRIRSARSGDWRDFDAANLLRRLADQHGRDAVRLGCRLYFLATLGAGSKQSFEWDALFHCVRRAERVLARAPEDHSGLDRMGFRAELARHRDLSGSAGWVDPYRLTTRLLARHQPPLAASLLRAVFT